MHRSLKGFVYTLYRRETADMYITFRQIYQTALLFTLCNDIKPTRL